MGQNRAKEQLARLIMATDRTEVYADQLPKARLHFCHPIRSSRLEAKAAVIRSWQCLQVLKGPCPPKESVSSCLVQSLVIMTPTGSPDIIPASTDPEGLCICLLKLHCFTLRLPAASTVGDCDYLLPPAIMEVDRRVWANDFPFWGTCLTTSRRVGKSVASTEQQPNSDKHPLTFDPTKMDATSYVGPR